MKDPYKKTRSELVQEISLLKNRIKELEQSVSDSRRNEEHLSLALQRLHSHIENSPLAFVEFDPELRIVYWSGKAESIFGWSAGEMLGRNIDQMKWVHEDDAERIKKLSGEMHNGLCLSNVHTNRNYRKDGSVITCEWYNSALLNSQGKLVSIFSSVLDITSGKRAEEALKESEEKFRALADSTPTTVMLYQDDRFIYVNRAAEITTGYSREELLNMNFWNFIHPDYRKLVQKHGRKRQKGEESANRYELRFITKDGMERWADLAGAFTIIRGRPAGIVTVTDITERRQMDEALREAKDYIENIIKSANVLIVGLDINGRITMLNEAGEKMIGYRADEVIGRDWFELVLPKDSCSHAWDEFNMLKDKGILIVEFEKPVITKSGDKRLISWRNSLLMRNGEVIGMISFGRDITDHKRVEEEREKLILELQEALNKVKTLSGLLPICAACKKIRNDKGYWEQIEVYIQKHSEAEFTHGICPECGKKLYPEYYSNKKET